MAYKMVNYYSNGAQRQSNHFGVWSVSEIPYTESIVIDRETVLSSVQTDDQFAQNCAISYRSNLQQPVVGLSFICCSGLQQEIKSKEVIKYSLVETHPIIIHCMGKGS